MSADETDEAELRDILLDKVPEEVADKILVYHTLSHPFHNAQRQTIPVVAYSMQRAQLAA